MFYFTPDCQRWVLTSYRYTSSSKFTWVIYNFCILYPSILRSSDTNIKFYKRHCVLQRLWYRFTTGWSEDDWWFPWRLANQFCNPQGATLKRWQQSYHCKFKNRNHLKCSYLWRWVPLSQQVLMNLLFVFLHQKPKLTSVSYSWVSEGTLLLRKVVKFLEAVDVKKQKCARYERIANRGDFFLVLFYCCHFLCYCNDLCYGEVSVWNKSLWFLVLIQAWNAFIQLSLSCGFNCVEYNV